VKRYRVVMTKDADQDLLDIDAYLSKSDSFERADYVIGNLEQTISSLDRLPQRGHMPLQLLELGITDYLEIHWKPYRIVYQIKSNVVYIHGVFDGRRDMVKVFQERLLSAL